MNYTAVFLVISANNSVDDHTLEKLLFFSTGFGINYQETQ